MAVELESSISKIDLGKIKVLEIDVSDAEYCFYENRISINSSYIKKEW